ncbi:MAG: hypothetical protein QHJ73_08580 [Armatimonadota bacterium]|nr:hypothetical protein [Armatimonadota bacterium]
MNMPRCIALAAGMLGVLGLAGAGWVAQTRQAVAQGAVEEWLDEDTLQVTARERNVAGRSEGEVLIGESVVTRIRSAAGGMTPAQRATTAAARLEKALTQGDLSPDEIRVAQMNGEYVVVAGDQLIVTADAYHASVNGTTPEKLAAQWRSNLAEAYRAEQARPISKICPIISVGSGVRVGLANLTGPRSQVHQAAFVGQLETKFQEVARIRIFVPIKSKDKVDRVPQVNVNAYADLKL